ncbi:putative ammonia-lyase, Serine racemase [Helianthus annuus]|nr:putative ammonia-lyase, Serine racemase [Helianthus annuus]KAJ0471963.1 putative ammonia-lyase, Serine racemase [Helianthus annuus]
MDIYNIDGTSVIKQYANLTPAMRSTALYSLTEKHYLLNVNASRRVAVLNSGAHQRVSFQLLTAGGGLISGVVVGAKSRNPAIRVLVAEPKGADDAAQSKACGRLITLSHTNTIADGLRASLGDITW